MRWILVTLLMVSPLCRAESFSSTAALGRLFTTPPQREQIDLERQRAMSGEQPEEPVVDETKIINPDIYFQAILYRGELPPLLWLNGLKATLEQWQAQRDLLVVEALVLEPEGLRLTVDGQPYRLQPNQILNRETGEVVEAHRYQPGNGAAEVLETVESETEPDNASVSDVLKQAASVNQAYKQMPTGTEATKH